MAGEGKTALKKYQRTPGAKGGPRPGAGRPKNAPNKCTRDLKELAREYTADALRTYAEIMLDGESEAARISAATAILDRGYGKPTQTHDAGENILGLLADVINERRAKVAQLNG